MRSSLFFLILPIAACTATPPAELAPPVAAEAAIAAAPAAIAYPETRRTELTETQFGLPVADPYRWLENDVRTDPEVRAWVDAQNGATNALLETLPGRAALKARMTELYDYERFGVPLKEGGRYFYTRNDGLQNQSVLFVRDSVNGEGRQLIDPNTWSADGATALGEWVPSEDGKHVLYTIQEGGTDWRTVRVLDVATGKPTADEVKWVKFSNLDWAKDGSGFYYSRFPEPQSGGAYQSLNNNQEIFFHRLGTPQGSDLKIYSDPARPDHLNAGQVSDDGRWLIVSTTPGGIQNEIRLIDLRDPTAKPRLLVAGFENQYGFIGNRGPLLYFVTNRGAPKRQVVAFDIRDASPMPKTMIAEGQATLNGASLVGGRLVVNYLVDAKTEVRVHTPAGVLERKIGLPGIGTAGGFSGEFDDPETFYAFTSFNRPMTIYRYDLKSAESAAWATPKVAFNPDDYNVEQRFYASKDGTRIPMFIVRKAGTTGPAPTILYGYGGFNASMTPSFSSTRLAWLENGGVWVLANIRGGGEYGKAWHDAGRLANKQNVYDDFIAAGEYLKAQGITSLNGLAISGGSNGGLLVGAVVNQRPDLINAAHPAVGVMDMLRFDRFTAGRYWVDDYGFPNKEPDFRTLVAYSPYHNVKSKVHYPPMIITTADTDDRVVPGHSFKYAAAIQAADPNGEPHVIRIETRAGHGSGKPTSKIIEESADVYAFLARYTGLELGSALPPSEGERGR